MDKVKWMSAIEKVCKHYVLWTSVVMILFTLCGCFRVVPVLTASFPKAEWVLNRFMEAAFIFGVYNITICGVSGIGMLFTKGTRIIGMLALAAAVSFCGILHDVGDAL